MKITTLIILCVLCVSFTVAKRDTKRPKPDHPKKHFVDPLNKDKREAAVHHHSPPRPSHSLHFKPTGGSSLSIGAGYSFGGSKTPSFGHSYPGSFGSNHFSSLGGFSSHAPNFNYGGDHYPSFGGSKTRYTSISGSYHNPNTHSLNAITGHKFGTSFGGGLQSGSIHSALSNSGLHSFGNSHLSTKPQISYGIPQYAAFVKPESMYVSPVSFAMPAGGHSTTVPSYASGIQGLGAYASNSHAGISGPLFMPASSHYTPTIMYGIPSNSLEHLISATKGKKSYAGLLNGDSKGLGIQALGGLSAAYGTSTKTDFKPSLFLGASEVVGSDSHNNQASSIHSALLSGKPIYVTPKILLGDSHGSTFELSHDGQANKFQGSATLTGSYDIPSSGHSASALSFGTSAGGYAAPSVSYGAPSLGHESSNYLGSSDSHVSISPAVGHGSYDSSTVSHGSVSPDLGTLSSNHGPSSTSYSSTIHHGSSNFGSPHNFAESAGYAGFSGIGSGKQELPLQGKDYAFSSVGHETAFPSSLYSEHGLSSTKEVYEMPHKAYGAPKGSYSSHSNIYTSAPGDYRQTENRYDTIKYSRDFTEEEPHQN